MDSRLYEELCRIYLADQFGMSVEDITSRVIPNPQQPGDLEFSHQIDHYWETGSDAVLYINIANAKWRTTDKADQGEVLEVHAVKELIRAHKALLITSTDFTKGARGLAAQHGIGLHVVRPTFDHASIPLGDRVALRSAIAHLASEPYTFNVVHRGLDPAERPTPARPSAGAMPRHTTRQLTSYTHRMGPGPGSTNRRLRGGSSSGGGPPARPGRSGGGGGGFTTREGGGRGFTRGGGGFERG